MSDLAQILLANLDQMVAGMAEMRKQCSAECREVGFETDLPTPLTDGLVDVARAFLELRDIASANAAMDRVMTAAEIEWDLIELQARLEDLREHQSKEEE